MKNTLKTTGALALALGTVLSTGGVAQANLETNKPAETQTTQAATTQASTVSTVSGLATQTNAETGVVTAKPNENLTVEAKEELVPPTAKGGSVTADHKLEAEIDPETGVVTAKPDVNLTHEKPMGYLNPDKPQPKENTTTKSTTVGQKNPVVSNPVKPSPVASQGATAGKVNTATAEKGTSADNGSRLLPETSTGTTVGLFAGVLAILSAAMFAVKRKISR